MLHNVYMIVFKQRKEILKLVYVTGMHQRGWKDGNYDKVVFLTKGGMRGGS